MTASIERTLFLSAAIHAKNERPLRAFSFGAFGVVASIAEILCVIIATPLLFLINHAVKRKKPMTEFEKRQLIGQLKKVA